MSLTIGKMAYDQNQGGGFQGQGGFQRKMYQGNWKCAKCNTDITELPFEPDPDKSDRLMCRDCYREKRQSFGGDRRGGSGGGGRPNFRR